MSKKATKTRKLQAVIPSQLYERLMKAVSEEISRTGSMKGALGRCVTDAIEVWLKQRSSKQSS